MPTEKEIAEMEEALDRWMPINPLEAIDCCLQIVATLCEHEPPVDYPAWKDEAIDAHSRAMDIIIMAQKKIFAELKDQMPKEKKEKKEKSQNVAPSEKT